MHQKFFFTFPDELDVQSVTDLDVYNGFILTLPFRLRTGTFFSVKVSNSFEVVFRNLLDIPCGTSQDEIHSMMWDGKKHRPYEQFFTEALILGKNVSTSEFREQLIAFFDNTNDQKLPNIKEQSFEALKMLNEIIIGYHHATNSLFGGAVVEQITSPIFFERLRYAHTIVCPSGYDMTKADLLEILDAHSERIYIQVPGLFTTSQLDDVPSDQLSNIPRYIKLHQQFIFYLFVIDAKSKMVEQDFVTAILFVVVALEGVLSTVLQMRLDLQMAESFTDSIFRTKKVEATANRFLKDIGLSESIEMIPLLFLEAQDRPTDEDIKNCKSGVTIRNQIMHTSVKNGQYRLRNRSNKDITDAYTSVLKVVNHFIKIVERDFDESTQS